MKNCVYFYADVDRRSVWRLVQKMELANAHATAQYDRPEDCVIYVYVQSGGGDAHAGLSAMDHIRNNRVSVVTVADGLVASAATFLLLGGSHRVAMSHATILIHEVSTSFWGKHSDLVAEAKNSSRMMDVIKRVYAERTTIDSRDLDNVLSKDTTMNGEECRARGFVEDVW